MTVGVVAYQGDFGRHLAHLRRLDVDVCEVRTVGDLSRCDGVVIPGGESTTIGKLLERFGLLEEFRSRIAAGFPVFGTCAGAILLADEIESSDQPRIGGLPITIRRNAYGRQIASFEAEVEILDPQIAGSGEATMHGIFIRAPRIITHSQSVIPLLRFEDEPVAVRQENLLAATFHSELTPDLRLHEYFVSQLVACA